QVPSGFEAVHSQINANPGGYPGIRSFWKEAGSSESAVTVTASGGQNWIMWCASVRITGARTSGPIGNVATTNPTGTSYTLDAPDVTIQNDGSGAVLIFGCAPNSLGGGDRSPAPPSGTTLLQGTA